MAFYAEGVFLADVHETAVGACFADADKTVDRAYIADTPEMAESANTDSDGMAEGLYLAETPYLADKGFYAVGAFWAIAACAEMLDLADGCILAVWTGITVINCVWLGEFCYKQNSTKCTYINSLTKSVLCFLDDN